MAQETCPIENVGLKILVKAYHIFNLSEISNKAEVIASIAVSGKVHDINGRRAFYLIKLGVMTFGR
jgi:hypothetical protein